MSLFGNFYDNAFYKNLISPQGITCNPYPEGFGGVSSKHNFYLEINCAEQNGYFKILIGCVSGNGGRGRGVSCLPIIFDY
jgi:hypothetical protein